MRQSNLVFSSEEAGSALFHPDRKSVAGWQKEGRNDPSPCRTVPTKIRHILFQQNFEKSAAGKDIRAYSQKRSLEFHHQCERFQGSLYFYIPSSSSTSPAIMILVPESID